MKPYLLLTRVGSLKRLIVWFFFAIASDVNFYFIALLLMSFFLPAAFPALSFIQNSLFCFIAGKRALSCNEIK